MIYQKVFFAMLSLSVVLLYLAIYLAIVLSDNGVPVLSNLFITIKKSWASLFTLAVVPIITFVFKKYIKNKDKKDKQ